jgi:hypothetical protein
MRQDRQYRDFDDLTASQQARHSSIGYPVNLLLTALAVKWVEK